MTIVDSAANLASAYETAKQHDAEVFAEQLIEGPEYTVSVIGGKALPTIKLETDNQFYDYEAKYQSEETRYLIPCGLSDAKQAEISQLAERCFSALGCSGWGRVDFMADAAGNFYALEVNTVPGMTSHSLVPMAAKASGLNFEQLCLSILAQTLTNAEQL
jgi:D-alanine-D-alanine ligase